MMFNQSPEIRGTLFCTCLWEEVEASIQGQWEA